MQHELEEDGWLADSCRGQLGGWQGRPCRPSTCGRRNGVMTRFRCGCTGMEEPVQQPSGAVQRLLAVHAQQDPKLEKGP